jgi:hypothetical protein
MLSLKKKEKSNINEYKEEKNNKIEKERRSKKIKL